MNKTLQFDFNIPEHTLSRLDELLDRAFTVVGITSEDTNESVNQKFMTALKQTNITTLTALMARDAWLKVTGQISHDLDYTETGVLIGMLAVIVGDIPSPSIALDKMMGSWK